MSQRIDMETGEVLSGTTDAEILKRPFRRSAVQQRDGGGGRIFDYISGETCIRRLNEATNDCWTFRIVDTRIIEAGQDRNGNPEHLILVQGELTLPGLGTRSGHGVQRVNFSGKSDDLTKGAASDCLKKCATQFGVALELYGPSLDGPDLNAGESQGGAPDKAQRMTNLAQGPQRPANGPTPIRQPGQAMEAVRAISGAHTLDVREESRPSPRAQQAQQQDGRDAYPYQQIFERKTDMAAVNNYLVECRLRGGNKGECIRAVNDYAQHTHGAQGDIVIGTGAWNEQYKRNDVYPMDIANALAHYVAQESTAGASEAKAAAERDATNDDEWNDIPF